MARDLSNESLAADRVAEFADGDPRPWAQATERAAPGGGANGGAAAGPHRARAPGRPGAADRLMLLVDRHR